MTAASVAIFVVLAVLLPLALAESVELAPWLASRLVRWGAKRLGVPEKTERYEEEWLADLESLPGKLTKVCWACGVVLWSVPRLRLQFQRRAKAQIAKSYVTLSYGWGIGRRKFRLLGGENATPQERQLVSRIDKLAARAGIRRPPVCLLAPFPGYKSLALLCSKGQRSFLILDHHLVLGSLAHPERFDAVVLHELAHLRNRDLWYIYLMRLWWCVFGVLLPTGYLAALATSGRSALPSFADLVITVALTSVTNYIMLSLRGVFELRADAMSALWVGTTAHMTELLSTFPDLQLARPGFRNLYLRIASAIVDPDCRLAALRSPKRLYRAKIQAVLGIVASCVAAITTLKPIVSVSLSYNAGSAVGSDSHRLSSLLATFATISLFTLILLVTCCALYRSASRVSQLAAAHREATPEVSETA